MAKVPVPHELPLTVIEPEVVVTQELSSHIPQAKSVPHAAVAVIDTLPAPVDEILAFPTSRTPMEGAPVPQEVPWIVSEPELVVTEELFTIMPLELCVPFAAVPVIVTLPTPVAEILVDVFR